MIIRGKTIDLRLVEKTDAEFILSLRLNNELNKHLSEVSSSLDLQVDWIQKYKKREVNRLEYYFIIQDKIKKEKYGTVRLYDFREDSFCWGSWIIKPNSPAGTTIQSFVLSIGFGFDHLVFQRARWDVRKENKKAIELYELYGANIVAEDELNYYFEYMKEDYEKTRERYKKYLD